MSDRQPDTDQASQDRRRIRDVMEQYLLELISFTELLAFLVPIEIARETERAEDALNQSRAEAAEREFRSTEPTK